MTTTIAKLSTSKRNVTEQTGEQLLLRYRETGDRDLFAVGGGRDGHAQLCHYVVDEESEIYGS